MTGLAGHDAGHLQLVWLVASALGVAAMIVLGVLYRRARARHELEELDQVIEAAFAEPRLPADAARVGDRAPDREV